MNGKNSFLLITGIKVKLSLLLAKKNMLLSFVYLHIAMHKNLSIYDNIIPSNWHNCNRLDE